MSERKKVIAALSECNPFNQCYEERCPYYKDNNCLESLHEDALKLLKEQEPVKPTPHMFPIGMYDAMGTEYLCGNCGFGLTLNDRWRMKYCPECGRAVKWDG